jgi:dienelactone hydrolase
MPRSGLLWLLVAAGVLLGAPGAPTMPAESDPSISAALPATDTRALLPPRDLDTPRTFPTFTTRADWEARRAFIRQQLLVSFGLYPLPPKTPLKARLFGRMERDGYSIEKVTFQTYPGFYLAGNLYRPLHAGHSEQSARHPGILVAHGHWAEGRMADTPDGSIPARAITFARQGCVAFTYDMVGYNDTHQIDHGFANDRKHWLWGVTLMGLQTWNSMRALDFLCSLPDVDTSRLAITGESGGGTQTMMLGALDDRLAAVGPCVMVSHTMQGGCLCENAPGLRVGFSNMEIAACAAPRPQILVGATGDWTKTTLTVEGPALASIYKLYGVPDHLHYVLFDYGHNINKTSREAVYAFFGKWLLHENDADKLKEPPYKMEPVASLRVFPDGKPLPKDAKDADTLTNSLMLLGQTEVERRKPHNKRSLTLFRQTFLPAWQHTLGVEIPAPDSLRVAAQLSVSGDSYTTTSLHFGRAERGDNIPALLFLPNGAGKVNAVVIAHPDGKAALLDTDGAPGPLVHALLAQHRAVLLLDAFLTGERADPACEAARHPFEKFFTTYNRTDLQERVQDLVTACAYLHARAEVRSVALVGEGQAGLWALLAAPAADAVAADCVHLDLTTDDALLTDALFTPCLRRLGDFHTAAVLAAPHPLLLQNTGDKFTAATWIADVYQALDAAPALHTSSEPISDDTLIQWITHSLP